MSHQLPELPKNITLGEFVRNNRKAKRLTLEQVARMSGTSKSYIWELENGHVPKPGFLHCIHIAYAIGASIEDMAIAACDDDTLKNKESP